MTDIKYLDEATQLAGWGSFGRAELAASEGALRSIRAHAATLEREDKFRQEVSDAISRFIEDTDENCSALWAGVTRSALKRFITPAPDPVATALEEAMSVAMCGIEGEDYTESAKCLVEELARRGVKLVEVE